VVDPSLLECGPPCLARLSVRTRDQAQAEIVVQDAQRRCRRRVDRFLPDQVVNVIEGYGRSVVERDCPYSPAGHRLGFLSGFGELR